MPWHVPAITPNFALLETLLPFYIGAKSSELLEAMLMRGFNIVLDAVVQITALSTQWMKGF